MKKFEKQNLSCATHSLDFAWHEEKTQKLVVCGNETKHLRIYSNTHDVLTNK